MRRLKRILMISVSLMSWVYWHMTWCLRIVIPSWARSTRQDCISPNLAYSSSALRAPLSKLLQQVLLASHFVALLKADRTCSAQFLWNGTTPVKIPKPRTVKPESRHSSYALMTLLTHDLLGHTLDFSELEAEMPLINLK